MNTHSFFIILIFKNLRLLFFYRFAIVFRQAVKTPFVIRQKGLID